MVNNSRKHLVLVKLAIGLALILALILSWRNLPAEGAGSYRLFLPVVTKAALPDDGMVLVPAGEFQMGCDESNPNESCLSSELPLHTVRLDAFRIHKYEVTNEQYARFLNDRGSNICGGKKCMEFESSYSRIALQSGQYVVENGYKDHPVIEVSWFGGRSYCTESGERLPSEAEWEKAARGSSDTRLYAWGNQPADCTRTNFNNDGFCVGDTAPVGSYPSGASPYGVFDMTGNVWELVNDWYDRDYYDVTPDANPPGPASGTRKVIRGGSWYNSWNHIRIAIRASNDPTDTVYVVGFRCASTP